MYLQINDLLVRLKSVLSKRTAVVLGIWGEAGIGKTYTVQQILEQMPCKGFSLHATVGFPVLIQTLKAKNLEVWAEHTFEQMLNGQTVAGSAAADAVGVALTSLAPAIMHLEDIHEADPERLEFIIQLAQIVLRSKGVGLLLTSRTQPPEPIAGLRLEPLGYGSAKSLLETQAGAQIPKEALDWIFTKANGNPLFTLEYFRHLSRMGNLWSDGQQWRWRVPQSDSLPNRVEVLIERMLETLTQHPKAQTLLEIRALLTWHDSPELWQKISGFGPEIFEQEVGWLTRQGILHQGQFRHPLFREVSFKNIRQRSALARRIIAALEDQPLQAVRLLPEAELEASEAQLLLQRAISQAQTQNNPLQAARLQGQLAQYYSGIQQAQMALDAAKQLKHSDIETAQRLARLAATCPEYGNAAIYLQAELEAIQGRIRQAERLLLPLAHTTDYPVQLLKLRGSAMDYGGVLELLEQYPELLKNPDAETAHRIARALVQKGQIQKAETLVGVGLARVNTEADRALLLRASAQIALVKGDYAKAEQIEAQIQTLARQLNNLRLLDQALFNRALALEGLGRYRESMQSLEQALQTCLELGDRTAYLIAQVAYCRHLTEFGEYQRAEEGLLEAQDFLMGLDPSVYLFDCQASLTTLYLEWQPIHGSLLALKHARNALQTAQALSNPRSEVSALLNLIQAEAQVGSVAQVLELAAQLEQKVQQAPMLDSQHSLLLAWGYAYRTSEQADQALNYFRQAEAIGQEISAPIEQNKLGLEIAQLSLDIDKARKHLEWFESQGLNNGAAMAKRNFPSLAGQPSVVSTVATVRLEVLGPMQLALRAETNPVRGRKRQELLALLLEAHLSGRGEVARLSLLEALYPSDDEIKGSAALRQLVSSLRNGMGEQAIKTTAYGYALGEVGSDAEDFLRKGDSHLWRGVYLEGVDTALLDAAVSDSLHLALEKNIRQLIKNNPQEAARLARILLLADPYNQSYLALCLQAFKLSGNHKTAGRIYNQAKEQMQEVGAFLPDKWLEFLDQQPISYG